jgi:hypothetical protein
MKMRRVWEILNSFKEACKRHGWKTCESEDWVETGEKYHNFLWARSVHLSSFKRLISNRKCVVPEGLSYHVVESSYVAWLFSQTPTRELVKTVFENPDLSCRIAIYDLSPLLDGKRSCARLNNTGSPVFQEFENFLGNELKVKIETLQLNPDSSVSMGSCEIPELA